MSNLQPHISIIAGPNGSGKSTCGPALLQTHFNISEFVNADTIATGISAFNPEDVAIEASRIMLKRLKTLASQKKNFAFETNKVRFCKRSAPKSEPFVGQTRPRVARKGRCLEKWHNYC